MKYTFLLLIFYNNIYSSINSSDNVEKKLYPKGILKKIRTRIKIYRTQSNPLILRQQESRKLDRNNVMKMAIKHCDPNAAQFFIDANLEVPPEEYIQYLKSIDDKISSLNTEESKKDIEDLKKIRELIEKQLKEIQNSN